VQPLDNVQQFVSVMCYREKNWINQGIGWACR